MNTQKQPIWLRAFQIGDTRRKLLTILGLLLLYRLLTYFPLPGVSSFDFQQVTAAQNSPDLVTGFVNLLSGGAYFRLSVLALGLLPYASANSLVKLLMGFFPSSFDAKQIGSLEANRRIKSLIYWLLAPCAVLQAYLLFFVTSVDCSLHITVQSRFNFATGLLPAFTVIACLTAGAYFVTWIAELINLYGFQSLGFNAIIFTGAALMLPEEVYKLWKEPVSTFNATLWQGLPTEAVQWLGAGLYLLALLVGLFLMVNLILGKREFPVMFSSRMPIRPGHLPSVSKIPVSISMALDAIIDVQSLLTFIVLLIGWLICSPSAVLQTVASAVQSAMAPKSIFSGPILFLVLLSLGPLIADLRFSELDLATNLEKSGGQILGIRRGQPTANYLQRVFRRIIIFPTLLGGLILLIPWIFNVLFGFNASLLAGEALLLMVTFVRDLDAMVSSDVMLHSYDDRSIL